MERSKQLLVIFLLGTFFSYQYERHVRFMECTISYYLADTAGDCDCSKKIILLTADNTEKQQPLPAAHTHQHFNTEYDCFDVRWGVTKNEKEKRPVFFNRAEPVLTGCFYGIDHPPQKRMHN